MTECVNFNVESHKVVSRVVRTFFGVTMQNSTYAMIKNISTRDFLHRYLKSFFPYCSVKTNLNRVVILIQNELHTDNFNKPTTTYYASWKITLR